MFFINKIFKRNDKIIIDRCNSVFKLLDKKKVRKKFPTIGTRAVPENIHLRCFFFLSKRLILVSKKSILINKVNKKMQQQTLAGIGQLIK